MHAILILLFLKGVAISLSLSLQLSIIYGPDQEFADGNLCVIQDARSEDQDHPFRPERFQIYEPIPDLPLILAVTSLVLFFLLVLPDLGKCAFWAGSAISIKPSRTMAIC